jgi:plasmid stabilization system protein ParE
MIPIWSPEAIDDLAALRAYIEQDDPAAAKRIVLHIVHNVEMLLPGHPGSWNTRAGDSANAVHRALSTRR